jgi:hypothetical protein
LAMSTPEEGPNSAIPSTASPVETPPRSQSAFSPKLVLSLIALWVGSSALLYWISKSAWWLCALGGLGAVLVIWPGPKAKS